MTSPTSQGTATIAIVIVMALDYTPITIVIPIKESKYGNKLKLSILA